MLELVIVALMNCGHQVNGSFLLVLSVSHSKEKVNQAPTLRAQRVTG